MTNCTGAYASADDYISFACISRRISRVHTGLDEALSLTDSMARFKSKGVAANEGMILYNLTDGSQGYVTAVTDTNLEAALAGGVDNFWEPGDVYLITAIDAFERATIENYLTITASDVAAAVSAGGQCDCAISAWGAALLMKLNIIDALSFYTCPCMTQLTDVERQQYRNWMDARLEEIRTGKVDICGGPGSDGPAFGSSKEAVTVFAASQIVLDRILQGRD